MQMGVLNYSAAARFIQKEVEDMLRREVELNTLVATLVRMSRASESMPVIDMRRVFEGSRVAVTTGISQIEIRCSPDERRKILSRLARMNLSDTEHLSVHQFSQHVRILCSSRDAALIQKRLGRTLPLVVRHDCATVNIKIHNLSEDDTTSIAVITDLLNRNDINILASYSVQNDILLVLKEEDVARAIDTLRVATK